MSRTATANSGRQRDRRSGHLSTTPAQGRLQMRERGSSSASAGTAIAVDPPVPRSSWRALHAGPYIAIERMDSVVLGSSMVLMCFGAAKFSYRTPPAAIPGLALSLSLCLLASFWALGASISYLRWREPTIALLRLVLVAAPLTHFCVFTAGANLALITPGPLAPLLFLGALIFISQSFRLAIVGLGLPLSAPLHAAVQLLCLAIVWSQNVDACSVVLQSCGPSGRGCAGGGAWFRHLTFARMPPPPGGLAAGAGAEAAGGGLNASAALSVAELTEGWYSVFAVLPMLLPHPVLMPLLQEPSQQCGALLGLFQVVLGFLLPVGVQVVHESRVHCLGANSGGAAVGRSRGGQLMGCVYCAIWGAMSDATLSLVTWALVGMLAFCWLGVTALV